MRACTARRCAPACSLATARRVLLDSRMFCQQDISLCRTGHASDEVMLETCARRGNVSLGHRGPRTNPVAFVAIVEGYPACRVPHLVSRRSRPVDVHQRCSVAHRVSFDGLAAPTAPAARLRSPLPHPSDAALDLPPARSDMAAVRIARILMR
jgi:hypothetical protein